MAKQKGPWRPPTTAREGGAAEVDWSRTFHVNNMEGFVNGLFALHTSSFDSFLADAGQAAAVGETLLYQVKDALHVRFELKKLGPHEYEVRGAHFATRAGVNICIGLNPLEEWGRQAPWLPTVWSDAGAARAAAQRTEFRALVGSLLESEDVEQKLDEADRARVRSKLERLLELTA